MLKVKLCYHGSQDTKKTIKPTADVDKVRAKRRQSERKDKAKRGQKETKRKQREGNLYIKLSYVSLGTRMVAAQS